MNMRHFISLVEGVSFTNRFLIEGYKEAVAAFSKEADSKDVNRVIDAYKSLVNRNQVKGDERNIDWWAKQGWVKFSEFVAKKSEEKSTTQIKRKKIPGKSLNLRENEEWFIVIPLDKDASCFHGKNSDWCTTKTNQTYFEDYFYDKEVILIYCLNKKNGGMWAIAAHEKSDKIEMFDQRDKSLSVESFSDQTGLNPEELVAEAKKRHGHQIRTSRDVYNEAIAEIDKLIWEADRRSEEIEKLLRFTKSGHHAHKYMARVFSISGPQEYPEDIILLAVKQSGSAIEFIKNPPEAVQMSTVKQDSLAIKYIENPSEAVQMVAIKRDGYLIEYIKNPSEAVQMAAVKQYGRVIQFIKNPSESVQLAAVGQDGYAIEYIKNPSEAVRMAAVERNGPAIQYIENPSEAVQLAAVKRNSIAIKYIKKPSETVQMAARTS